MNTPDTDRTFGGGFMDINTDFDNNSDFFRIKQIRSLYLINKNKI